MKVDAYHSQIKTRLIDQLEHSTENIKIAVAWFTNHELMNTLKSKLSDNVSIELIILNDEINFRRSSINFSKFIEAGGKLFLSNGLKKLHHKICIIDNNRIITGSYNWTYYAEQNNHENILFASDAPTLTTTYLSAFETVKSDSACVTNLDQYHVAFPPARSRQMGDHYLSQDLSSQAIMNPENISLDIFDEIQYDDLDIPIYQELKKTFWDRQPENLRSVISNKSDAFKNLLELFYNWDLQSLQKHKEHIDITVLVQNNEIRWTKEKIETLSLSTEQKKTIFLKGHFDDIDKLLYESSEQVDWNSLYQNTTIVWTRKILNNFRNVIDFGWLFHATSRQWTAEDIDCFYPFFKSWQQVSYSRNVEWSADLIDKYIDKWYWRGLSSNESLPWSNDFFEKYIDRWDFKELSTNSSMPFSPEIIKRYETMWDWRALSKNESMKWDSELILICASKIPKGALLGRSALIWNEVMLRTLSDWLDEPATDYINGWGRLSNADGKWKTPQILERFENKFEWGYLASNTNLDWNTIINTNLSRHVYKWYRLPNTVHVGWEGLANNPTFPWSSELIETHKTTLIDKQDFWRRLSANTGFKMDINFIKTYSNLLNFSSLSWNPAVQWSDAALKEFRNEGLLWTSLSKREDIMWNADMLEEFHELDWDLIAKNQTVFNQIVKPILNTLSIDKIMTP